MTESGFDMARSIFAAFYTAVKEGHERSQRPHRGHGLDHDVTVAQLALLIAPDTATADLAWCAAMLHSTDRIVERGNKEAERAHMLACLDALPRERISPTQIDRIMEAALRHGELNQTDQSLVQQVLMDADRLANLMPSVVIRAGQFLPGIPAFEFEHLSGNRNPESNYYSPQSVLDDLRTNIAEYPPKLRVPKAKKLARRYVRQLKTYIRWVESTNRELGLTGITL